VTKNYCNPYRDALYLKANPEQPHKKLPRDRSPFFHYPDDSIEAHKHGDSDGLGCIRGLAVVLIAGMGFLASVVLYIHREAIVWLWRLL
jgi:hypothetical protein